MGCYGKPLMVILQFSNFFNYLHIILIIPESKKRKNRDWEANDYYDSDEDTFLDRTGTIEKKRANRMKTKNPQNVETYQSLV